MSHEKNLPYEMRLDALFDQNYEKFYGYTDNLLRESGSILDTGLEYECPELVVQLLDTAEFLATVIHRDQEAPVVKAIYKSLLFGYEAASIVYGERAALDLDQVTFHLNSDDPYEAYAMEIEHYLEERPYLNEFIEYYDPKINPSKDFNAMTELATATIFMLVERSKVADHIDETFNEIIKGSE